MDFKIISDLDQAKLLWNKFKVFTSYKSLFYDWDFRYCFNKYYNVELLYILGLDSEKEVGLLPIQYNNDKKHLEFFGGSYMEDNQVFIDPNYKEKWYEFFEFMKQNISEPYNFDDVIIDSSGKRDFVFSENKYVLELAKYENYDDYFMKGFSGKRRKNMRNDFKRILSNEIVKELDVFSDIELLIKYIDETYGSESTFRSPFRREIFRDITKLNNIHMISYKINEEVEGVSLYCLYDGIYVFLANASDRKSYPNLGKYIIFDNIKNAFKNNMEVFDVGVGACNWKDKMSFEEIAQYKVSNANS